MEANIKLPASVQKSIGKYKAMGILIEPMESGSKGNTKYIKFRVKQIRKDTDRILTGKELHDRAKEALQELATEYKVHILPLTIKGSEIENVSASWVLAKMAKHNLKQADLCLILNIDKHVISKLLSNEFAFTRWHKAAFYFFFQTLEIQRSQVSSSSMYNESSTNLRKSVSPVEALALKKSTLAKLQDALIRIEQNIKECIDKPKSKGNLKTLQLTLKGKKRMIANLEKEIQKLSALVDKHHFS